MRAIAETAMSTPSPYRKNCNAIEYLKGFPCILERSDFCFPLRRMARHFRELTCWQLARSLKGEVTKLLKKPVFGRNLRFRENLSDAASSARRNIAEGFGRRGHKEFARFLNISLSSLKEVEDSLIESVDNEWVTQEDVAEALQYCKRTSIATARLRNSIKDKPDPPWCQ